MARKRSAHRVAVIYPFAYHFREAIFRSLCRQSAPAPTYDLYSGPDSPVVALKLIDPRKATIPVEDGGLRWRFLENVWLRKKYLWQRGLNRLALSGRYDTIIFYGFLSHLSTWTGILLARLTGKRVLIWTHGPKKEHGLLNFHLQLLLYRLGHGWILFGHHGRYTMLDHGFRPERCYLVFNSLDYDRQKELRDSIAPELVASRKRELFAHPELPVLVFIGRLVPKKRLGLILEAAHLLEEQGLRSNILFIGDGPETSRLQAAAAAHNMTDRVCFYGPCHEEQELATLLMLSSLCVSPGFVGLTAMHALAYGTPVASHDDPLAQAPEFEAIIPRYNGILFRRDDVRDMARAIHEWFSLGLPPERIRENCIDIVERYYNPAFQTRVFNAAVEGVPATELPQAPELDPRRPHPAP